MARLKSETFDFWPINTPTVGTVTKYTTDPRHGPGAASCPSGAFNEVEFVLVPDLDHTLWYRFYFKLDSLPTATTAIWRALDKTGTILEVSVSKTGKVELWNGVAAAHPNGSAVIGADEWHLVEVELLVPTAGNGTVAWRFDEESMAAPQAMNFRNLGVERVRHGNPGATVNGTETHLDDLAVNDDTGESQNTWVGGFPDQLPERHATYFGADMAETKASGPSEPAPFGVSGPERQDEFERQAKHKAGIIHTSDPWDDNGPRWDGWFTGTSDRVHARGAIMMKSLGGPEEVVQRTLAGEFDEAWERWAEEARAWGHAFYLRLWWEMNGNWFNWGREQCTGAEFRAAWRHIHAIVTAAGAKNVTFVWCPNVIFEGHVNPFGDAEKGFESMYPGDDVVDWTAFDGYSGENPHKLLGFRTAKAVMGPIYELLVEECPDKPIIICECACSEYVLAGHEPEPPAKAQWIEAFLGYTLPYEWPQIRAVCWFNWYIFEGGGRIDWEIGSSPSSEAAVAAMLEDPHWVDPPVNSFRLLEKVPLPGEVEVAAEVALPTRRNGPVIPCFQVPLRTDATGDLAVVEQDSAIEIAQSVYALISTERGAKLDDPDYGVEEASFEVFPPEEAIGEWLQQIERYEPRARVRTRAELEDLVALVTVEVSPRS